MGRIGRSWHLLQASWAVLKQDKELAILPLLSGLCLAALSGGFVLATGMYDRGYEGRESELGPLAFLLYVVLYTVAFFFQAAWIAGASERRRGGNPTLGSALGAASKRLLPPFLWGVVAATVGMLLRALEDRSKGLGRLVTGLLGAAWSLMTFFMVPVLVMEGQGGGGSFKRSWELFKKTWGETVAGNLGVGIFGFLGFLSAAMVGGLIAKLAGPTAGIAVGMLLAIFVGVVVSALSGVYTAALYQYATREGSVPGFEDGMLSGAFVQR